MLLSNRYRFNFPLVFNFPFSLDIFSISFERSSFLRNFSSSRMKIESLKISRLFFNKNFLVEAAQLSRSNLYYYYYYSLRNKLPSKTFQQLFSKIQQSPSLGTQDERLIKAIPSLRSSSPGGEGFPPES